MQIDNTPPSTSISTFGTWKTQNFTATDNDTIEKAFYQVLDYNGNYWTANPQRGFFGDNFDTLQPLWSIYNGTWSISNGELMQNDENETNTNYLCTIKPNSF